MVIELTSDGYYIESQNNFNIKIESIRSDKKYTFKAVKDVLYIFFDDEQAFDSIVYNVTEANLSSMKNSGKIKAIYKYSEFSQGNITKNINIDNNDCFVKMIYIQNNVYPSGKYISDSTYHDFANSYIKTYVTKTAIGNKYYNVTFNFR